MSEKTYNTPNGFLCPVCHKGMIKMSLYSFLYDKDVKCPVCGMKFSVDKSQCENTVNKLQNLYMASKEVERLKKQNL